MSQSDIFAILDSNEVENISQSSIDISEMAVANSGLMQDSTPIISDLICLSHLRWDFVFQRPQHLLTRCAQNRRVFFVEEPIFEASDSWRFDVSDRDCGMKVVVPYLPENLSDETRVAALQELMTQLVEQEAIAAPMLWYYTPMALPFTAHLEPSLVVYDCMDELSAFKGASPTLRNLEAQLFEFADLVFTGGHSLYEAKRQQHPNVYAFPSSIDFDHFSQARYSEAEPADQANIPHPRIGFYGVIDERMDLELLDGIAQARPDWHFVIIGPIVKINPETLPCHPNLYYLGGKSYKELPDYLAGWDVAMLPFARNESTRFISPTKTPEYLAAGKPVVSTSIRDVVRPYGDQQLVLIADTVPEFIEAIAHALRMHEKFSWREKVDEFLSQTSWDKTWLEMIQLIENAIALRNNRFIQLNKTH